MAEQNLNLRERTTIITGPVTNLTLNIATLFTQNGSDVVFIDKNFDACQRVANNLNDQREINEKFGRATSIKCDFTTSKACQEALSQAAQAFGSIDIYIDGLSGPALAPLKGDDSVESFEDMINYELKPTFYFSKHVVSYLKNRKRGRLIYLVFEPSIKGSPLDTIHSLVRGGLLSFVKSLSLELSSQSTTANVLCLGPSEEYLLQHFPDVSSIKEAQEKIKSIDPNSKLLNSESVAGTLLYLCSALGNSTNGQTLTLV